MYLQAYTKRNRADTELGLRRTANCCYFIYTKC